MQLYLVKLTSKDGSESFHKVGVTKHTDIETRFAFGQTKVTDSNLPLKDMADLVFAGQRYIPDNPYNIEVINKVSYKLDGDALVAERDLLKNLASRKYRPNQAFSGDTECFQSEGLLDDVIGYMKAHSEKRNREAPSELRYAVEAAFVKEPDPIKKHELVLQKCKAAEAK